MNTRTHTYPTALAACFDFAGREMVERWQDEEAGGDIDSAEQIAIEYLLELVNEGERLYAVTFTYPNNSEASGPVLTLTE